MGMRTVVGLWTAWVTSGAFTIAVILVGIHSAGSGRQPVSGKTLFLVFLGSLIVATFLGVSLWLWGRTLVAPIPMGASSLRRLARWYARVVWVLGVVSLCVIFAVTWWRLLVALWR